MARRLRFDQAARKLARLVRERGGDEPTLALTDVILGKRQPKVILQKGYRVFYITGYPGKDDGRLSYDLPKTYATRGAAQAAINKHVADVRLNYKRSEYKVVPA